VRLSILGTICKKELRETLRDRMSLFLTILLPLMLYPAILLIGGPVIMMQVERMDAEAVPILIVAAEDDHPIVTTFQDDSRFDVVLARSAEDASDHRDRHATLDLSDVPADFSSGQHTYTLQYRSVDDRSHLARERVEEVIQEMAHVERMRRILEAGLVEDDLRPLVPHLVDQARSEQRGGSMLGALLPMFLIVTIMTGVGHAATDLTAGERERKTLQTLLVAPITPVETMSGKFLAVTAIGLITGTVNLVSLTLVVTQSSWVVGDLLEDVSFALTPAAILVLMVCVVLISMTVSAIFLVAAALAPGTKEAQGYIAPVYLICITPAFLAQMPGFTLDPTMAFVPIAGIVLLMKEVLVDGVSLTSLFSVTIGALIPLSLAMVLSARIFSREEMLTGRPALDTLFRSDGTRKRTTPTLGEGVVLFCAGFLALYYVGATVQSRHLMGGLLITLWLVVLAPTLLFARVRRVSMRETFSLRRPNGRALIAAALLGSSVFIVLGAITVAAGKLGLNIPPELAEQMTEGFVSMIPGEGDLFGWVLLIFAIAISPAICEELMFRGFILSAARDAMTERAAILASALLFGVFHLSLYRLFGTTMLGVLMAWLVIRSASIFPAMIFHALNNALAIGLGAWLMRTGADEQSVLLALLGPAILVAALGFWVARGAAAHERSERDPKRP